MIKVKTERQNGVLSASVDGRIDGSNVVEFEETIRGAIDKGDRAVIMDFEKLSYISSAGLRAILLTGKTLGSQNAKLVLCAAGSDPRGLRDQRFRPDLHDPSLAGGGARSPRRRLMSVVSTATPAR